MYQCYMDFFCNCLFFISFFFASVFFSFPFFYMIVIDMVDSAIYPLDNQDQVYKWSFWGIPTMEKHSIRGSSAHWTSIYMWHYNFRFKKNQFSFFHHIAGGSRLQNTGAGSTLERPGTCVYWSNLFMLLKSCLSTPFV